MRTQTEHEMRTALRQAGAIAAVGGQLSLRRILNLAHRIYSALILLAPEDRARRIRLIDAIFGAAAHGSVRRRGEPCRLMTIARAVLIGIVLLALTGWVVANVALAP